MDKHQSICQSHDPLISDSRTFVNNILKYLCLRQKLIPNPERAFLSSSKTWRVLVTERYKYFWVRVSSSRWSWVIYSELCLFQRWPQKVSSPESGDQTKIKTKMWNSSVHFHHCYASEFSGEHFKLMELDAVYGQWPMQTCIDWNGAIGKMSGSTETVLEKCLPPRGCLGGFIKTYHVCVGFLCWITKVSPRTLWFLCPRVFLFLGPRLHVRRTGHVL